MSLVTLLLALAVFLVLAQGQPVNSTATANNSTIFPPTPAPIPSTSAGGVGAQALPTPEPSTSAQAPPTAIPSPAPSGPTVSPTGSYWAPPGPTATPIQTRAPSSVRTMRPTPAPKPISQAFPRVPTRLSRSPNALRIPTKYLPGARAASNRKSVRARSRGRNQAPVMVVPQWAATTNDDINAVTAPSIVALEPYIACSRGCPAVPVQCSWRVRCGDGCFCGIPDGSTSAPTPTRNRVWTDDGAPTTVNDDILPAWPNPSARPSLRPTPSPTRRPTARTPRPSRAGDTIEPTALPTIVPSPEPTAVPSPEPTPEPSPEPTPEPTPEPRTNPTPRPSNDGDTIEPTWFPTTEPTMPPVQTRRPTPLPSRSFAPTGRGGSVFIPCSSNCPAPPARAPPCGFFQTCGNGCFCGTAPGVPSPPPTRRPTTNLFAIVGSPTLRPGAPRRRGLPTAAPTVAPPQSRPLPSPASAPVPAPVPAPVQVPTPSPTTAVPSPLPTPYSFPSMATPTQGGLYAGANTPAPNADGSGGGGGGGGGGGDASSNSAGSAEGSSGSNNTGVIAGVSVAVVVLLVLLGLAFWTFKRKSGKDSDDLDLLNHRMTVDKVLSLPQSQRLSMGGPRRSSGVGFDHSDIYAARGSVSESPAGGRKSVVSHEHRPSQQLQRGSFAQRSSFAAGPGISGPRASFGPQGGRAFAAGNGLASGAMPAPRRASANVVRADPRASFV